MNRASLAWRAHGDSRGYRAARVGTRVATGVRMGRIAVGCWATIVVLFLTLGAGAAEAQSVGILPASGVNLEDSTLQAAQDVFRGHLTQTARFRGVRSIPGEVGHAEIDPRMAVEVAR